MQALWLENQELKFRPNVQDPVPGDGEALIRLKLAGVCSTDLELVRGYYPFTGIPGHEFVGEVVSSPGDASWVGKRVVGEINIACGVCKTCKLGMPRHCEQRKTLGIREWNGVFADLLVLPLRNLHIVPEAIPDEVAVFAEPLAAACEILEQVNIHPLETVLIIGAGRLGQLVAQVLQTTGSELVVVARYPKQQELLADRDIKTVSEANLGDEKYDFVIEATGTPGGFMHAMKSIRPRGTIILKSTYKAGMQVNFSEIVVNEINLVGSRCGPFKPALRLMEQGKVNPRPLVEAVYTLDKGVEAFENAARAGVLKILIQPG